MKNACGCVSAEHPYRCGCGCKNPDHPFGCSCGHPDHPSACQCPPACTACDRDRANNLWVEGADAAGNGGICLLDNLDEGQIVGVLQRDPKAAKDLIRVTTNPRLIELANTVPMFPTTNEGDEAQKELNQNSIPFYSIFRGQPPFAQ